MFKMLTNNAFLVSPSKSLVKRFTQCIHWNIYKQISTNPKDHYEILKLSRECTSKEIREAFITLSKKYHPDKNKGDLKAQEEFVKVNEAYNTLIKPESRRDYDFNLQQFAGKSRVYKSPNKDDYYEVHRYDSYRDPWKDPSFARNRNFSEEDDKDYYGIRGVKKQSNDQLLFWILLFAAAGIFIQISIIRFANMNTKLTRDRMSEENRRYLEFVKARAEFYGTRERQIEEIKRRLKNEIKSDKPD